MQVAIIVEGLCLTLIVYRHIGSLILNEPIAVAKEQRFRIILECGIALEEILDLVHVALFDPLSLLFNLSAGEGDLPSVKYNF